MTLRGDCLPQGETGWNLDFVLENVGGADVEARVALPYVFYHFEQDRAARVFNPLFGGVLEETQTPLRISYPGPASFCLTAAAGDRLALAVGLFNDEQRHVVIRHIPAGADGQIRLVLERVLVKAGQSVCLPRMFISLGEDWAEAMRVYRDWFASAFPRTHSRPGWWQDGCFSETRKAHCLVPFSPPEAAGGVWIFDNEGKPRTWEMIRTEIDEAVEQGRQNNYVPLFYQFGWWQSMSDLQGLFTFDSLCGDYNQAHVLAKQAVEYIHRRGARTYFYTNAISAGDETEVYCLHPELFARDRNGFPYYNVEYPMLLFCPGAPGLRTYWERILRYLLVELGVDGVFLDQVCGGAPPVYCYDPGHNHAHPDTYGRDMLDLIAFIFRTARWLKPDAYIGGELVHDARGVLLDEAHGYGYTGPRPVSSRDENTPLPEYYVFTRYLCPQIYSSTSNDPLALMNGAAGHASDPFWREHRAVFESSCAPCKVETPGVLAYFYGPFMGRSILAVRGARRQDRALVQIPSGLVLENPLPDGVEKIRPGTLAVDVETGPRLILLAVEQKKA